MSALPETLETLRTALNDAADSMRALDTENVRLLAEVGRLTDELESIKAGLDGAP